MKTPLWDIEPLPSLLFDPDTTLAEQLAAGLRCEGLPVEVAQSYVAMLSAVRSKYFRTLIVVAERLSRDCAGFLVELRRTAPRSWVIIVVGNGESDDVRIAYQHGIDAVVVGQASVADLRNRIAGFQLRSRPNY